MRKEGNNRFGGGFTGEIYIAFDYKDTDDFDDEEFMDFAAIANKIKSDWGEKWK